MVARPLLEKGLLSWFSMVSVAAATAGGGPAAGASVAGFLATPAGKAFLQAVVENTIGDDVPAMALGGLVTQPTIALIGEAGPEMVIPLVPKKKRKVSMYQKEFGRQMKRLKKQHTLKNGSLRKSWTPKRLMNAAHAAAKRARR